MFPRFFCFEGVNYAYATQQGILTKIGACKHFANTSKGQILRALSNLMRPFDTPIYVLGQYSKRYRASFILQVNVKNVFKKGRLMAV